MTALAKELPLVGNLSLSAVMIDNKLTLLYKVNEGVCDQSFGINVAQLADFPQHIIEVSFHLITIALILSFNPILPSKVCQTKAERLGRFEP